MSSRPVRQRQTKETGGGSLRRLRHATDGADYFNWFRVTSAESLAMNDAPHHFD